MTQDGVAELEAGRHSARNDHVWPADGGAENPANSPLAVGAPGPAACLGGAPGRSAPRSPGEKVREAKQHRGVQSSGPRRGATRLGPAPRPGLCA